jgi:MYXO-CTERM domain-containing protein
MDAPEVGGAGGVLGAGGVGGLVRNDGGGAAGNGGREDAEIADSDGGSVDRGWTGAGGGAMGAGGAGGTVVSDGGAVSGNGGGGGGVATKGDGGGELEVGPPPRDGSSDHGSTLDASTDAPKGAQRHGGCNCSVGLNSGDGTSQRNQVILVLTALAGFGLVVFRVRRKC